METVPAQTRLHIPVPSSRPGQQPDFSNIEVPNAGAAPRPDELVDPHEIPDLAVTMIRVLNKNDEAVGPWAMDISPDLLRNGLRYMMTVRVYDDRMFRLQRQGKLSFYMKSTGEEAVSVAAAMALRSGDMLFPSYRQQGLLIARDRSLVDMMCHCLSNTRDSCKGRQMPVMYSWKAGNFFSISGNLGTQLPQAVGWAMGAAYKNQDHVAAGWVGDGTTAEGDFHYALTFASVYQAPAILNVVNNQWAISSYQGVAGGEHATFAERAHGYGLPGLRVDGNDFLAVYAATKWAARRARKLGGPTLIELFTYRVEAHSSSDDPSQYRPQTEASEWPLGDPIERLKNHLIKIGEWSEQQHQAMHQEIAEHVQRCYKESLTYGTLTDEPQLPPGSMFDDVYKEPLPHLLRQRKRMEEE
ncbi:MAG: 3-methyl-2-oxobutanoate dehydrogenase (2-methylpropanoyl-transferring) subunit alpha [Gammaproteobacteria bacterium]|nr:3-methyl-2-oxobutanoate dehydrogenase (2-methylpropanoyl-transferring) subunit alpha [Gammaproteobacteria bacterium]